MIVVYVDDILLASKTKEDEGWTLSDLSLCFKIKELDEAELYLGYYITRNGEARTLTFDQNIYAKTVAKRFNTTKISMISTATRVKTLYLRRMAPRPSKKGSKCVASHTGRQWGP